MTAQPYNSFVCVVPWHSPCNVKVIHAEILPRDFFSNSGETITWHLLQPNFKDLKKFINFQRLDRETISLKNIRTSHPVILTNLQIVGCTAEERHRMKKLKFNRL